MKRPVAAGALHPAAELAAECYVAARTGVGYRRLHREYPNPLRPAFWVGMAGLALVGTVFSIRKGSGGK